MKRKTKKYKVNAKGKEKVSNMIKVASLTRKGFVAGDISTVMSPRTILYWAENNEIFNKIRKLILVLFILCEIIAQFLLTRRLYLSIRKIESYIFFKTSRETIFDHEIMEKSYEM